MTKQTALIVPDLQIPFDDARYVDKLLAVASEVRPDKLFYIGDLSDSTQVGRWVKDKRGEFDGQLQAAFDRVTDIVTHFREATGWECQTVLVDSNHDERVAKYVEDNAPALADLRCLDITELFGLVDNDVKYLRGPVDVDPHTVAVHGHEKAYSSVSMKYGLDRIKEYGKNVIYGHTHQAGLAFSNVGYSTKLVSRYAMNVGHGMNLKGAGYLKDGHSNWTQAFGIIRWDGRQSYPELVTARNGKFHFNGRIW